MRPEVSVGRIPVRRSAGGTVVYVLSDWNDSKRAWSKYIILQFADSS